VPACESALVQEAFEENWIHEEVKKDLSGERKQRIVNLRQDSFS
jgi:hypothetical protein